MKQDIIRDVGMKTVEDDLLDYFLISIRTSEEVTEGNVSSGGPVNGRSGILIG